MIHEIRAPQININDDTLTLVEWLVEDGTKVNRGEALCAVETTKASVVIDAEHSGFIKHHVQSSDMVAVQGLVGWIADKKKEFKELGRDAETEKETVITAKARKLAESLDLIPEDIPAPAGILREKNVRQFAHQGHKTANFELGDLRGEMDQDFVRDIQADPAFAALSSEEKISRYRDHGAVIEDEVIIGANTVIIADYIELKRDSAIGQDCSIKAQSFSLGRMSILGDRINLVTRHVKIGDVYFGGNDILIGGARAFSSTAHLIIGHSCLISSGCIINTGNGIRIGNEVALSPHVKLFTHNHWQNVLEGYHASFGPIVIEDQAYITGDCLVAPNVQIGKGATVLANSTVASDVPASAVVSGNPARVIGKTNHNLSLDQKERILRQLMKEMERELGETVDLSQLSFQRDMALGDDHPGGVTLAFNVSDTETPPSSGHVVFDLLKYEIHGEQTAYSDEIRNFLRRRGVRFKPIYWRYRADIGKFNV